MSPRTPAISGAATDRAADRSLLWPARRLRGGGCSRSFMIDQVAGFYRRALPSPCRGQSTTARCTVIGGRFV